MDGLANPDMTRYLIERLSAFFEDYHWRCFEAAKGLVDLTQVTDDFGSQNGLMISPRIFDTFYRASIQRGIDLAHSYGILVFHHDDGDNRRLLPRLVEMGIEVLNPIQWRCGNWDLADIKAQYGSKLCFHGGRGQPGDAALPRCGGRAPRGTHVEADARRLTAPG